jgi:hypothetical protein
MEREMRKSSIEREIEREVLTKRGRERRKLKVS